MQYNLIEKPTQGILLIHGLLDSPFTMRDIGLYLQSQGLLVKSILLPGHGTVPSDLLNVTYQEWMQAVQNGITELQRDVEKISIVGFSTGANLALYYALQNNFIKKLILIAPAIKIHSPIDFTANWYRIISWCWPRANWFCIKEENDFAKYQSITFNAIYQVYLLAKEIKKLSKIHPPIADLFFVLSQSDKTISTQKSLDYFEHYATSNSKLILYENIQHVALPIAPTNTHYRNFNPNFLELMQEITQFLTTACHPVECS